MEQGVAVVVLYVGVGALFEQDRETVREALGAADVGRGVALFISLVQADIEVGQKQIQGGRCIAKAGHMQHGLLLERQLDLVLVCNLVVDGAALGLRRRVLLGKFDACRHKPVVDALQKQF